MGSAISLVVSSNFAGKTKPLPVHNLTVLSQPAGLLISWSLPSPPEFPPSSETTQIPPAALPQSLSVEYQTVGPWLPLSGRLAGNVTSYLWRSASHGATYHFRVLSHVGQASPTRLGVPSLPVNYYAAGIYSCFVLPVCSVLFCLVHVAVFCQ